MKEAIRAIHDDEVANFFRSIGLLKELEEGKLHCAICGDPLTTASFRAATRVHSQPIFSCDRPSCYMTFILKTRGGAL